MGREVRCRARRGAESADGKALLETAEIVFRSPSLKPRAGRRWPCAALIPSPLPPTESTIDAAIPCGRCLFEPSARPPLLARALQYRGTAPGGADAAAALLVDADIVGFLRKKLDKGDKLDFTNIVEVQPAAQDLSCVLSQQRGRPGIRLS